MATVYFPPPDSTATTSEAAKVQMEKDYLAREYAIAVEEIKIMQEKLRECYIKEGVNHLENCRELATTLWQKIHTPNYGAPGPSRGVRRAHRPYARRSFRTSASPREHLHAPDL